MLLQHGPDNSADNWFLNGNNSSLGFQLVDRGYDLWLGNNRGNKYSKEHINKKKADLNYSYEQMNAYD